MTGRRSYEFQARDKTLALGVETRVMGIINVTPDSFSGDGKLKARSGVGPILRAALKMCADGADIIDVGGESTRPGALAVTADEECRRVVPLIEALASSGTKAIISVDTSKAAVAKQALNAGADLVNVVQSNALNSGLLKAVRDHQAGLVLMHMRGTPRTMQRMTGYEHLLPEILFELERAVGKALGAGVERSRMLIDPGIGFAKTVSQNYQLIRQLGRFELLRLPVLVGPSRKSFIGHLLGTGPQDRLAGTISASVASAMLGAHIVRVHDVLEVKQALRVVDMILQRET